MLNLHAYLSTATAQAVVAIVRVQGTNTQAGMRQHFGINAGSKWET
jgi:hypothetical protein